MGVTIENDQRPDGSEKQDQREDQATGGVQPGKYRHFLILTHAIAIIEAGFPSIIAIIAVIVLTSVEPIVAVLLARIITLIIHAKSRGGIENDQRPDGREKQKQRENQAAGGFQFGKYRHDFILL